MNHFHHQIYRLLVFFHPIKNYHIILELNEVFILKWNPQKPSMFFLIFQIFYAADSVTITDSSTLNSSAWIWALDNVNKSYRNYLHHINNWTLEEYSA